MRSPLVRALRGLHIKGVRYQQGHVWRLAPMSYRIDDQKRTITMPVGNYTCTFKLDEDVKYVTG